MSSAGHVRGFEIWLSDDLAEMREGDVRLVQLAVRHIGRKPRRGELVTYFEVIGVEDNAPLTGGEG